MELKLKLKIQLLQNIKDLKDLEFDREELYDELEEKLKHHQDHREESIREINDFLNSTKIEANFLAHAIEHLQKNLIIIAEFRKRTLDRRPPKERQNN